MVEKSKILQKKLIKYFMKFYASQAFIYSFLGMNHELLQSQMASACKSSDSLPIVYKLRNKQLFLFHRSMILMLYIPFFVLSVGHMFFLLFMLLMSFVYFMLFMELMPFSSLLNFGNRLISKWYENGYSIIFVSRFSFQVKELVGPCHCLPSWNAQNLVRFIMNAKLRVDFVFHILD